MLLANVTLGIISVPASVTVLLVTPRFPKLTVPASVTAARKRAAEYARDAGAEPEGVELAVAEAVANAVVHGFTDRPSGTIVLSATLDAGSLVSEEYLMALERKHFCALLENGKTQERIMGMLSTGKPVRN